MEIKRYIVIGHFKNNTNITSIADCGYTIKDVRMDCRGNDFIPYVILNEKKFISLNGKGVYQTFEALKHLTSNYYKRIVVTNYIIHCYDIMQQKIEEIEVISYFLNSPYDFDYVNCTK